MRANVNFLEITESNIAQIRLINEKCFPITYSDKFYEDLSKKKKFTKAVAVGGVIVGAVSCRLESVKVDEGSSEPPQYKMYIMTLSVLEAYRRLGIGSKMLNYALEECQKIPNVAEIYLHVHTENHLAIKFYKKHGFTIGEKVENYYSKLEEPHAFLVSKKIEN